jgi:hypothetical protein
MSVFATRTPSQHDYAMGRDPAKQATPDLFSTDAVRDSSRRAPNRVIVPGASLSALCRASELTEQACQFALRNRLLLHLCLQLTHNCLH